MAGYSFMKCLGCFAVFAVITGKVAGELAIVHAKGPFGTVDACALYNPHFGSLPQKLEETPGYLAFMPFRQDGCSDYKNVARFWNATSFVYAGNCSNYQKLTKAQQAGAKQVIIVSKTGNDYPHGTKDQFNYIHIPAGMITEASWHVMQNLGEPMTVQFWHPHDPLFDPNLSVIWLLACFSVAVGAYWSGITTIDRDHDLGSNIFDMHHWGLVNPIEKKISHRLGKQGDSLTEAEEEEDALKITPVTIVVFIGVICSFLLLLYFFYKYLIYAVIGLFAIAACNGTFDCLRAIISQYNVCTATTPTLPIFKSKVEFRSLFVLALSAALTIWWIVERHASYSWVLQDILGVCFCISLIKLIKLPSLKISALLLVALLVYDIFFVFITPLFSARGKSVMVEVATGKGSNEQLPMVIRVPKLIKSALSLCERPYSLLGFGDILLPGYGGGLIVTFTALVLMKTGQPALLYLVPCVLIPVSIVALLRKQFSSMWHGAVPLEVTPNRRDTQESPDKDIEATKVTDQTPQNERRPLLPVTDNH
eukprot:gene3813-15101_t